MTAVVLSVDYLRDRAVDFSVPLYVDQQAVGYKRPVFEADMLGFVKPYSYEVKKQIFSVDSLITCILLNLAYLWISVFVL